MKNLTFFVYFKSEHESIIKKLSYVPVGLGDNKFSKDCFTDKKGKILQKKI